jgi:hypothetical protein
MYFGNRKKTRCALKQIGQDFLAALYARVLEEMKVRRGYENELDKPFFVKLCVVTPRTPELFLPLLLVLTSRGKGEKRLSGRKTFPV